MLTLITLVDEENREDPNDVALLGIGDASEANRIEYNLISTWNSREYCESLLKQMRKAIEGLDNSPDLKKVKGWIREIELVYKDTKRWKDKAAREQELAERKARSISISYGIFSVDVEPPFTVAEAFEQCVTDGWFPMDQVTLFMVNGEEVKMDHVLKAGEDLEMFRRVMDKGGSA